jgi:hypothetical protein
MRWNIVLNVLVLLALFAVGVAQAQDDSMLSLEDIPAYVQLVAERALPGAEFTGFTWDLNANRRPVYRVQGTVEDQAISIEIALDGAVEGIVKELTMSEVPTNVIGMLDKYVPSLEATEISEATLASGVHRYEFIGRSENVNLVVRILDSATEITIMEVQN